MESQPQNPKFRNNAESFHPCKIIISIILHVLTKLQHLFNLFLLMLYIPVNNFSVTWGQ